MVGTSVCMPGVPALLRLTEPSQGDPTQCHHHSLQYDEPGKELSGELKSLKGQSPIEHQSRLRKRMALQTSIKLAKPPLVYPVGSNGLVTVPNPNVVDDEILRRTHRINGMVLN